MLGAAQGRSEIAANFVHYVSPYWFLELSMLNKQTNKNDGANLIDSLLYSGSNDHISVVI